MIRVIQIGLGVRGKQWAEVINKHPDTMVVAYVRKNADLAHTPVEQGNERIPCFSSLKEAFEHNDADAVVIVSPPEYHYDQVLTAFDHGCHVICEKPLSEKYDECIEMVKEAEKRNLIFMIGMNFRYLSVTKKYREIVQNKSIGEIGYGHFTYIRNRDGNRSDLNKYPLLMLQPMLLEQSIHHIDLLRYCYGSEITTVSAQTWRPSWSTYQDDCCVSADFQFTNGIRAAYLGTWTSGSNRLYYEWRTDFSKGTLRQCHQFRDLYQSRLDPGLALTGDNFKTDPGIEPWLPVEIPSCVEFIDDTYCLLEEFVESIQTGSKPVTSGKDHLKSLGVTLACVESSITGKKIRMDEFYKKMGIPSCWMNEMGF